MMKLTDSPVLSSAFSNKPVRDAMVVFLRAKQEEASTKLYLSVLQGNPNDATLIAGEIRALENLIAEINRL